MEKIIQKLASIRTDRLLHSFYGTLVFALLAFIDADLAMIGVVAIAVGKEVYDRYWGSGFDWIDVVYTVMVPVVLYVGGLVR